ncbi:hypothetical protein HN51_040042 [Arachis hypogaea]|uniref:Uncharacterized protein n=1 Tax=Arachis hypogaea TaxID=3818 RepID=A0A444YM67_ARAHY|nr:serine/threonine protein phosphatase 2A 57 kDa regulatory subunit B' beta isoform-like [Arachis ipaensis]XP_025661302.1 serine/threonine protein phosphatase 2A 57 kDa regulatory subunit B' beta isoform-like [Arachis hypogaea]RYR02978.1 hypothetical protein Ahy_B06g081814 [Arachis hypogaea]
MGGGNKKPSMPDSTNAVAVNHASRGVLPVSAPNSARIPSAPPPLSGVMEVLPVFRDVSVVERQNLFLSKLQVCCFVLNFPDTLKNVREKEIKQQTLMELVEFIQFGCEKLSENCQEEMIRMISVNIFWCLPLMSYENIGHESTDPEEEEPSMDPAWPHLQPVYKLLL